MFQYIAKFMGKDGQAPNQSPFSATQVLVLYMIIGVNQPRTQVLRSGFCLAALEKNPEWIAWVRGQVHVNAFGVSGPIF